MSEHHVKTAIPVRRWIEILMVLFCVAVLSGFAFRGIQQARNAARKTQSLNNLKQLGLALHNYHDVYTSFPLGTTENVDAQPLHGWLTTIQPFLEQSPLYSMIFKNQPWDHPMNENLFRCTMPAFTMPGAVELSTVDGFPVTHYMGNPNILHRASTVSLSDLTTGSSNNWLTGEVSGNYQPWGYQFNWRPLTLPLNSGDSSYGRPTGDGAQLCLADGSARFFANEVDSKIVAVLANAAPRADAHLTHIPDRVPSVTREANGPFTTTEVLLLKEQEPYGYDLKAFVSIDKEENAHTISFSWPQKGGLPQLTSEHMQILQQNYPSTKHLIAREWPIADSDVEILIGFNQLQTLIVEKIDLSDVAIERLSTLSKLQYFIGAASDQQQSAIETILPNVEFTNSN